MARAACSIVKVLPAFRASQGLGVEPLEQLGHLFLPVAERLPKGLDVLDLLAGGGFAECQREGLPERTGWQAC